MPPNIRLPKTSEEAKQLGNHSMLDYFSFPMKRERSKPPAQFEESKDARKRRRMHWMKMWIRINLRLILWRKFQRKHFLEPIGVRETIWLDFKGLLRNGSLFLITVTGKIISNTKLFPTQRKSSPYEGKLQQHWGCGRGRRRHRLGWVDGVDPNLS